MAEDAAKAASEAARTLQSRGQEVRAERVEQAEPANETLTTKPPVERDDTLSDERIEELRSQNPHDLAMEELYKRSDERQGLPAIQPETSVPAQQPAVEQPAAATDVAVVAETPAQPLPPEVVRVKVDGEEFDAPKAEVEAAGGLQMYQLQKASEKRLREATEARAEAKRLLDFAQRQGPPSAPPQPPVSDAQFIQQKMDVIRFGSPEDASTAMAEVLGRARTDPNAITAQAVAAMEHQIAVREFDRNFQDVLNLPHGPMLLMGLRQKAIQEAAKNRQPIDWSATYTKIGTEVRNALGSQRPSQPQAPAAAPATTGAPAPGPTSQVSEKEARKASIVNPPSSAARAAVPAEPKPESRADILNEMRKSRGQPTE